MGGEENLERRATGFPSVVPRAATAASPGTLEMHILRSHPDPPNQKVWGWEQQSGRLGWALPSVGPAGLKVSGTGPGASRAPRPDPLDRAGSGRARERASPGPGASPGTNLSAGATGRVAPGSRPDAARPAGARAGGAAAPPWPSALVVISATAAPRTSEHGARSFYPVTGLVGAASLQ